MLSRWQDRLAALPSGLVPGIHSERGINLVCPGDPGWPAQLSDLGSAAPYALRVRGDLNLQQICQHSVAVIGSRLQPTTAAPYAARSPPISARTAGQSSPGETKQLDAQLRLSDTPRFTNLHSQRKTKV